MFALPLAWMLLSSVKSAGQTLTFPVVWWPHPFVWDNYPRVLSSLPFGRFFLNTFLYCAVTIVGVCISSSLVAYGSPGCGGAGRNSLFYVMLMTLLLPFVCTLIPLFILYSTPAGSTLTCPWKYRPSSGARFSARSCSGSSS